MVIFKHIADINAHLHRLDEDNKKIGFVPTMGALHAGHTSLIDVSVTNCDTTVCSIFVNPTQFNDSSDFENYPNAIEQDIALLEQHHCDILFCPSASEIYPEPPIEQFDFGELESTMEGIHRPGHFNGMATVVSRLFKIIEPDIAVFGQKDFQQFVIIRKMVADMGLPIQLISCPIVREKDGLAMSSRNLRLSDEGRKEAPFIYQSLLKAKKLLSANSIEEIKAIIINTFEEHSYFKLDYFEIVDAQNLQPVKNSGNKNIALCIAAYLGNVRLIDNIIILP